MKRLYGVRLEDCVIIACFVVVVDNGMLRCGRHHSMTIERNRRTQPTHCPSRYPS